MNTGAKIKQLRLMKKITPKDIASALEMDVSNYYRIERDEIKPDIDKLLKLAEIMEVDPKEFLPEERVTFNIQNNTQVGKIVAYPQIYNEAPNEKLVEQLQDKIKDLEDKLRLMDEKNRLLEELVTIHKAQK